jgi:6-phosphofructokinase 1
MSKKIGILTSGGDCAGLNAVIRSVVHSAYHKGWETYGILDGTAGLLGEEPQYRLLTPEEFDGTVMRMGGTILGTTNKGDPFHFPMPDGTFKDRTDEIIENYNKIGLDAVIGIGGDGSHDILRRIAQKGNMNMVGIPKTIDNDIGETEASVGYDTAVMVATEALDRLQPTAASHDRVMILEVMGRDAGHIALASGIAGGADIILIPEIPYSMEKVVETINRVKKKERNFALMVVSEAVKTPDGKKVELVDAEGKTRYGGIGAYMSEQIAAKAGVEARVTVLGHVQRGSPPTYRDRLLATAFGVKAVDLIVEGKFDRMVAWKNREVVDIAIEDAIAAYHAVDVNDLMVQTARGIGISFGD